MSDQNRESSGWSGGEEAKPEPPIYNPYVQPGSPNSYQYNPYNPSNPYGGTGSDEAERPPNPYVNPYTPPGGWPDPNTPPAYIPPQQWANQGDVNSQYVSPSQWVSQSQGGQTYYVPPQVQETLPRPTRRLSKAQNADGTYKIFWTYAILWAVIGVFVLQYLRDGGAFTVQAAIDMGGLQPQRVALNGEWWRLITVMFLHGSFLHIIFNGLALYSLGTFLEQQIGGKRFVAIYFLGGLAGSVLSFGLGTYPVSVGASGAVFAVLGGAIGYFYKHRSIFGRLGRQQLNSLLFTAGINIVFTFAVPNIDAFAHIGGLVAGAFLGYFLRSDYDIAPATPATTDSNARAVELLKEYWPVAALLAVEVVLFLVFVNNPRYADVRSFYSR